MRGRMGCGDDDDKSMRILNRIVTWYPDRVDYEPDQRHAEIIIKQMGLEEDTKGVVSPGSRRDAKASDADKTELADKAASLYRAMAARANYLAQDRSDIRFAVKELCRRMAKPRMMDMTAMKRLARYLVGCPRAITPFAKQKMNKDLIGWSDSDWAGCVDTRKSTSGGMLVWGSHVIKFWSSTQDIIALSSGEAEYYAMVKTGAQLLGMSAMFRDLGISLRLRIKTDANAAKGISMRQGLGKLRHIETNQLWLQDKVHRGEFGIDKVDGKYNIADALTKPVGNEDLGIHISGVGIRLSLDRHQLAPKVGNWDEFGGFGVEE